MSTRNQFLTLLVLCTVMFWWRLGNLGLIDPDEPFYAQTTREMVQTNDWITPAIFGERQFEKPIFFYWQSMIAQKLFGDTEFAARVPSAVAATLLVLLTWIFGWRMFSQRAGFWSAAILATGVEYAFMARLMLTDICLALFITASVFCFWLATQEENKRDRWMILHFAASALAALTKGPLGLLVPTLGSACYLWFTGTRSPWRGKGLIMGIGAWLLITVPWYGTMFAKYGMEYWHRFFVHENWERLLGSEHDHSNHWWYYPMILTAGSLPWIPLLIAALVRSASDVKVDHRVLFLACWFVPNLLFFTIAQSKLPTYTFFLFVTLALLMGHTLDQWIGNGLRDKKERLLASILAVVQTLVVLSASIFITLMVPADSHSFIKDISPVIYSVAALISVPMILLILGKRRAWAIGTAVASCCMFTLVFTNYSDKIEQYTSTRGIGREVVKLRATNEPVVSSSFMARAVTYYTGKQPEGVVFFPGSKEQTQPYFTPHPPLNILRGASGLKTFAAKFPSVLVVGQASDLARIDAEKSALHGCCTMLSSIGDRVLFRIIAPP